jgi:hypothetical protein
VVQYHKDTVTVTYGGTANSSIVLLAFNIDFSQYAAMDSAVDMSLISADSLQLPLFGSGIVFNYNLGPSMPDRPLVYSSLSSPRPRSSGACPRPCLTSTWLFAGL